MLERLWSMMGLGCRHARLSAPYPVALSRATAEEHLDWQQELPPCTHYVVCVACGKRFAYDWNAMKVIKSR